MQLQNRLVPDAPVQDWTCKIEDLQPDIDRVLQVRVAAQGCLTVRQLPEQTSVVGKSSVLTLMPHSGNSSCPSVLHCSADSSCCCILGCCMLVSLEGLCTGCPRDSVHVSMLGDSTVFQIFFCFECLWKHSRQGCLWKNCVIPLA